MGRSLSKILFETFALLVLPVFVSTCATKYNSPVTDLNFPPEYFNLDSVVNDDCFGIGHVPNDVEDIRRRIEIGKEKAIEDYTQHCLSEGVAFPSDPLYFFNNSRGIMILIGDPKRNQ